MGFKVLVSDKLANEAIETFRSAPDIDVDVKVGMKPEELVSVIGEYDALIVRSATKVTADIIAKADRLKIIGRAGVGIDNVDRDAATQRGIIIMNTPGGNTISTAEHAWSHLLSLARNVVQAGQSMREGRWEKSKYQGVELFGKTFGVIGLGRVGSIVASRALAFGMKVLAYDPYTAQERISQMGFTPCGLDDLYSQSDFISLHCILTDETRHMIDEKAFAKMKKGGYIINCARGGIIDEEALLRALESGQVGGAGLDVFEKEPPPSDYPLLKHPRCVATPHLGASTAEAQINVAKAIAQQVIQALGGGEIRNAVNIPSVDPKVRSVLGPYLILGEKMGMFGIQLLARHPERVEMIYSGELGEIDTSLLTLTVLKGLLTPILEETVNDVNAPFLAEQRGIRYSETKTKETEGFSSVITVRLRTGDQVLTVSGTNLAVNDPRIVRINGYHVDAKPTGCLLVLSNTDEPGIIGLIGTILGKAGINIADLTLGRKERGGDAVTVCNVDEQPSEEVLREIGSIAQILDVKMVNLR